MLHGHKAGPVCRDDVKLRERAVGRARGAGNARAADAAIGEVQAPVRAEDVAVEQRREHQVRTAGRGPRLRRNKLAVSPRVANRPIVGRAGGQREQAVDLQLREGVGADADAGHHGHAVGDVEFAGSTVGNNSVYTNAVQRAVNDSIATH